MEVSCTLHFKGGKKYIKFEKGILIPFSNLIYIILLHLKWSLQQSLINIQGRDKAF